MNTTTRVDALREQLGAPSTVAATKVKNHLVPYVQAFIEHAPFAVLASSNAEGDCDASPKGGKPGFVKVVDERTLLMPDIGGNRLFQTFDNFVSNPKCGLVFLIPGTEVTARVNGRIEVLEKAELESRGVQPELYMSDEKSGIVQGFLLHIDEAYLHCPRSMQFADLWNAEVITTNGKRSLKDLVANSTVAPK